MTSCAKQRDQAEQVAEDVLRSRPPRARGSVGRGAPARGHRPCTHAARSIGACFRRPLRGGPRNGRGSGEEARRVRAFRVTAVSAETLRTLREVLIFVDQSAELVVSSDVVDRGSGAAGEWR